MSTEFAQGSAELEAELRAWDWRQELRDTGRTVTWLARRTDRAAQTVYQYANGQTRPSLAWLIAAARLLGKLSAT